MKIFFFLASLLVWGTRVSESRRQLICHTWRKVGMKPFQKDFIPTDAKEDLLTVKVDGTYEEILYGNLQLKGLWTFNPDSTKLAFAITSMNGKSMPVQSLEKTSFTDSLIQLTVDTLIDAHIAYYGPQKVYGHTDWYYVRVEGNREKP